MDGINIIALKDGDPTRPPGIEAPPIVELSKPMIDGSVKKKRRRGKYKRKLMKPFVKGPWQERRNDKSVRNNRFRKIVLSKTHAPFNNNQFLMEIHKPEPENSFQILQTPSARTRDSSFSVDSEDNYFYSLPDDEEEYLTKEFSSVYEDAQSERLSNMSKNELIQEYLLLEAKYDNLMKRTERSKAKSAEDITATDKDTSFTDKDSMMTDRDTSGTSIGSSTVDEPTYNDILQRMKEQEDQIRELQLANEKLKFENEHLHQRSQETSSEDSESDSSSSSDSASSSGASIVNEPIAETGINGNGINNENDVHINGGNEETEELEVAYPLVNGFHNSLD